MKRLCFQVFTSPFKICPYIHRMAVHIKKLVVGIDTLDEFARYLEGEDTHLDGERVNLVYTRYRPKRGDEILETGGSIYRIIKGKMCCRQEIIGFEEGKRADGRPYCLIVTKPEIIETYHTPHRPFQGWRYLKAADIPKDVGPYEIGSEKADIPPEMAEELRAAGLL